MTMSALLKSQVSPAEQNVLDVLRAAGFRLCEGWFYPSGDSTRAAVRLTVYGDQYRLERRRKLSSPWMTIVVADTVDFDATTFFTWSRTWPLTA